MTGKVGQRARPRSHNTRPDLDVPLVSGGRFRLSDQHPDRFTLVVFYRGVHCPICRGYLAQLDRALEDFRATG